LDTRHRYWREFWKSYNIDSSLSWSTSQTFWKFKTPPIDSNFSN